MTLINLIWVHARQAARKPKPKLTKSKKLTLAQLAKSWGVDKETILLTMKELGVIKEPEVK